MLTERQFNFWKKYNELILEILIVFSLVLVVIFFPFAFLFENEYIIAVIVLGFFGVLFFINNVFLESWKPWLNADSYCSYKILVAKKKG